jgi:cysteine desulfurase
LEHIYLDHAATTPTHPQVIEVMMPVYEHVFGNPSSIHFFGREARVYVDEARAKIANVIGASPKEIVFTSGGTESDNMAIIGTAEARKHMGNHIITTKIEHHAVLHTCAHLEAAGFEVTYLDVDQTGRISLEDFQAALRPETILVTIMYGNNEVGTKQPIKEIADILQDKDILLHTDAVQAFGLEKINVRDLGIDLMSMTAHKLNGPKGVGFLYIREGIGLVSTQHGGEQERKRRAGTHNVPGIVGMQKAVELAEKDRDNKNQTYRAFQKLLLSVLDENNVEYAINGDPEQGLSHVLNLYFPGTHVESLLMSLDLAGIAVSSGSACTAGSVDPSHVLTAMYGENAPQAKSSIRISFGLYNTEDQVKKAAAIIADTVSRLVRK